jgi:hypothetical protein
VSAPIVLKKQSLCIGIDVMTVLCEVFTENYRKKAFLINTINISGTTSVNARAVLKLDQLFIKEHARKTKIPNLYVYLLRRCYKIDRETRQHNRKASETASPTKSADSSIVSPRTTNKIASLEEANIPTPTRRGPGRPRKRPLFSDTADAVASSSKNVTSSQRPPVSMQHLDKEFVEKYLMKEL